MSQDKPPTIGGPSEADDPANDPSPTFRVVDRRHFANPENLPAAADSAEKPRYPTFVEELMARIADMESRFEEKKKQMAEEITKTRSRLEADYQRRVEIETGKLLLQMLDVLDNLERALDSAGKDGGMESLVEGVQMTASLFRSKLLSHGVEPVTVLDEPFDPNLGQAVGIVPVNDEARDGIVVEEAMRGYRMGGRLLRPAQVRVGKFDPRATESLS